MVVDGVQVEGVFELEENPYEEFCYEDPDQEGDLLFQFIELGILFDEAIRDKITYSWQNRGEQQAKIRNLIADRLGDLKDGFRVLTLDEARQEDLRVTRLPWETVCG